MLFIRSFILFLLCLTPALGKEKIRIGLEPFPPLVTAEGGGMTVDMLKAIEKDSPYEFVFIIAPYRRLKEGLPKEKFDLIGHTPYEVEVPSFYKGATELDWSYRVCGEIIFIKDLKKLKRRPVLGTLTGNKEFLESIDGMQGYDIFEHVEMGALLKMLKNKRVDAIWFGRPVLNHYLKIVKIPEIKRITFPDEALGVGLAVRKSVKGAEIKKTLEKLLSKSDWKDKFDKKFGKSLDCVQNKKAP